MKAKIRNLTFYIKRIFQKFILLSMISVIVSCDGSDCIHPADFGNLIVESFKVDSNPYDAQMNLKIHGDPNMSYVATSNSCSGVAGATPISAASQGRFWLDTGIDVVSLTNNLTIKVKGAANFCASGVSNNGCVPSENPGCTPSGNEIVEGCTTAKTLVFSKILSSHEQSTYNVPSASVASAFQPNANSPGCSSSTPEANSAYPIDNSNDFMIIMPRVYAEPYKTNSQITAEVDNLIAELELLPNMSNVASQATVLKDNLEQMNKHSETAGSWSQRGDKLMVQIYNDAGVMTNDLGLLSGSNFVRNPAPPSGTYTYNQHCCFEFAADNVTCLSGRSDADYGVTGRGYYTINFIDPATGEENPDAIGLDPDLYNYCDKDVFRYNSSNVTGFVKFKIEEEYQSCSSGNTAYCICPSGSSYHQNPNTCPSVTPHPGCWGNNEESCGVAGLFGDNGRPDRGDPSNTSSYDDNLGVYALTTKSSQSCVRSNEVVEFRIGADVPANIKAANVAPFVDGKYDTIPWNTGRLYVRVLDYRVIDEVDGECFWNGNDVSGLKDLYNNNVGKYDIKVRTVETGETITALKDLLFSHFNDVLNIGFQEEYYNQLVGDVQFQNILSLAMVLYIAFTAVAFVMGVTNLNQHDIAMRAIKIGIIYTLLSPNSWEFFSYLITFFEHGAEEISVMLAGGFIEENDPNQVSNKIYGMLDEIVYMFFQPEIHQKIAAVFFSPILVGIVLFCFIYYALFLMLYAIAKSILIYLVIKIVFAILFMVGPIFIIFSLFERTKQVFEQWLGMVISYSMQLIFLLLCIAFFSSLILNIFYSIFYYGVCWKPVWIIKLGPLPEFEFFSFWRFHGFDARYSAAYNVSKGPDFTSVLFLLVVAYCFKQMIEKVTDLGDAISGYGGGGAGSMAATMIKDAFGAVGDMAKSAGKNVALPMAGTALRAGLKPARMGVSAFGKGVGMASSRVERGVRGASASIVRGVRNPRATLRSIGNAPSAMKNAGSAAFQGAKNAGDTAFKSAKSTGNSAWKGAKNAPSAAWKGAKNAPSAAWRGMKNAPSAMKNSNLPAKMMHAKDALSDKMNKSDRANSDFMDISGNIQRAIGAGSLQNDIAVMDKYNKIVKQGIKDAKGLGLSGKEAEKFAIDSAARSLKSLDLPKAKMDEMMKRMQRDIKNKNIGTIERSSRMDSLSKNTRAKDLLSAANKHYAPSVKVFDTELNPMKRESNTARELISQKTEELKEMSKQEDISKKRIDEIKGQIHKLQGDEKYVENQREIAELEGTISYNREALQWYAKKGYEPPANFEDEIAECEGAIRKLRKKDSMRSLEAQLHYHKDNLNKAVDSKLKLSSDRKKLVRDQVLGSVEAIEDFENSLGGKHVDVRKRTRRELSEEEKVERREKKIAAEVASLEAMCASMRKDGVDLDEDFKKVLDLNSAIENSEEYAKSVDKALEEDRLEAERNYQSLTGDEFVSKLGADRGEAPVIPSIDEDEQGISDPRGREKRDPGDQDLPKKKEDDPTSGKKARDTSAKMAMVQDKIGHKQGLLQRKQGELNSSGANKEKIEKEIQELRSEISSLNAQMTKLNE